MVNLRKLKNASIPLTIGNCHYQGTVVSILHILEGEIPGYEYRYVYMTTNHQPIPIARNGKNKVIMKEGGLVQLTA